MFTGIIEELGTVHSIRRMSGGKTIRISADKVLTDVKPDDSVAVNGVCLTVTRLEQDGFWVDAVGETLDKSTIGELAVGHQVNLERALKLSDRLGGHLVQGHVNGVATVSAVIRRGENYFFECTVPNELLPYIIEEGSIAIDGISLTVASLQNNKVGISVIPHTYNHTVLKWRKTGQRVNVEVDVLAKYVERILTKSGSSGNSETFSENWFKKLGY